MAEVVREENEEAQTADQRGRVLRDLAILLSALLGSAVAILQVLKSLPGWFLFVAAAFYAVSMMVVIWTFWPSIFGRILAVRAHRQFEAVAAHHFLDLLQLVDRFGTLLEPSRVDSVHYVLRHIGQEMDRHEEFRGRLTVPETSHLNFLFEDFTSRFQTAARTFETFRALGREFELIVAVYHYTFVLKPYDRVQELGMSMIPSPYRKSLASDLELQRENYSAFLRDLQRFSERVNLAADREIFRTYYSPLKKVEMEYVQGFANAREEVDRRVRAYCQEHNLDPKNPDNYLHAKDEIFRTDPDLKEAYARS